MVEDIAEEFDAAIEAGCRLEPSYNVAPTHKVAVIIEDGARKLTAVQWGLIPPFADSPAIGARLINARAETISTRSPFAEPFRFRRCLVVASGFYEWRKAGRAKLPVYISLKSGKPFG